MDTLVGRVFQVDLGGLASPCGLYVLVDLDDLRRGDLAGLQVHFATLVDLWVAFARFEMPEKAPCEVAGGDRSLTASPVAFPDVLADQTEMETGDSAEPVESGEFDASDRFRYSHRRRCQEFPSLAPGRASSDAVVRQWGLESQTAESEAQLCLTAAEDTVAVAAENGKMIAAAGWEFEARAFLAMVTIAAVGAKARGAGAENRTESGCLAVADSGHFACREVAALAEEGVAVVDAFGRDVGLTAPCDAETVTETAAADGERTVAMLREKPAVRLLIHDVAAAGAADDGSVAAAADEETGKTFDDASAAENDGPHAHYLAEAQTDHPYGRPAEAVEIGPEKGLLS